MENENWKRKDTKNLLVFFMEKLRERAVVDRQGKELSKDINSISFYLAGRMVEEKVESLKLKCGVEVIEFKPISEENYALDQDAVGTDKWDNPKFFEWLKDLGEDGLIKETLSVPSSTRKKFLKTMRAQNIELPPWIVLSFIDRIKYNDSAIKRVAVSQEDLSVE